MSDTPTATGQATNENPEQLNDVMEHIKEFHPDLSGEELEKHAKMMAGFMEQYGGDFSRFHAHREHGHHDLQSFHGNGESAAGMRHSYANFLLRPDRESKQPPEELVRRLGVKPDLTILELGPGPGYYSPALAKSVPNGKIILVDAQQGMLDAAKERLDEKGFTNTAFIKADARGIPLEDETVDIASLALVLGEIREPEKALAELHRILKPGGLLSITEDKLVDPDYLSPEKVVKLVPKDLFTEEQRFESNADHTINFRRI